MKCFLLFILFYLLILTNINVQNTQNTWQKTFGGKNNERAFSIQQTTDGGYIVVGYTDSFGAGNRDFYIIKLDNNGNKIWDKTFGERDDESAKCIQKTADGGYIVAGHTKSYGVGDYDIYIIKLDSEGNKLWDKTYGGKFTDYAYSIQQTKDGGYIVAGLTNSFGKRSIDIYIIRLDKNGNKIWDKTFGGKDKDWVFSIQQTNDGDHIIAGFTSSFAAGGENFYILKLDSSGNSRPYSTTKY